MAKRTGRLKNQLPTCYYEGYLEKRSFKDKTSRKLWTCLCGNTLFFFNDKRDSDYVEKMDLRGLISITDDSSQDRNLDAARLNVQMKDENIKFTAPNAEARELWKGYINSVAKLSVPTSLNLLPGQIHMLKEAVENERERQKSAPQPPPPPPAASCSPYVTPQPDMPACYHAVSRLEAELLLDREAKRGNLLLRPGSSGNSFAVSTRQDHDGPVFRHYRLTRNPEGGFIIDVDNPVHCDTLYEVIDYLVEKTDRVLIPLIIEEAYEKNISFIQSDKENGEQKVVVPPTLPPKPVAIKIPHREPEPEPDPIIEENIYLNDEFEEEKGEEEEDSSPAPLPPENKPQKKPLMPPIAAPRRSLNAATPSSTASSTNTDPRMRSDTDPYKHMPLATISELKLKFEQRAKTQQ
ncbi:signal-transducing adaptor protein 1-like isoform X1 [Acanthochromis polyacanthus]|uniref:signal-transducing adaptor protein 1-like isoform X1 n=1 Tax=Acanthochromis polyacanthus TaxID=80966 RepID=UPI0022346AB7|nr:signal-transducing adaptor protein 1-like isoform X1 [Acanthochromis polyacanthus]